MTRAELIERLFPKIEAEIRRKDRVFQKWLLIDGTGKTYIIPVPDDFMESDYAKNAMVNTVRTRMREVGVVMYAWMSEAWITEAKSEEEYRQQYDEQGWSTAKAGGRREIVFIVAGDKDGTEGRCWTVERSPDGDEEPRRVQALVADPALGKGLSGGRFADLLVDAAKAN